MEAAPVGDVQRLGVTARAWRTGLVLALTALFLGGTWHGNDDWWPFGPWRMFATSTGTTGGVAVLAIETRTGPDLPWQPASINLQSVGLNRAEVEGRVPQMVADPGMLGTLAATHSRLRPHEPRWTAVRVVREVTVIVDRRPTGEQRRSVVAEWDAPPVTFLFPALPVARVALLRRAVYAFVLLDVLWLHHTGYFHGWADPVWYRPLKLGEVFHLPAASVPLVRLLLWGTVAGAVVCLVERLPVPVRAVAGWLTCAGWVWFQYVAFSYGKVDHDRGDFAVALLVLPLVAWATVADRRRSEAAGFVLRAVQLAAIATYFLSAWAKVRFGGWDWVNSATILRAVIRRGNWLSERLVDYPFTLHWFQWVLFTLELTSPVIFLVGARWQHRMVFGWYAFHAMTYAMIGIAFWPHLVMMLAFLPLESYRDAALRRMRRLRQERDPRREPALVR